MKASSSDFNQKKISEEFEILKERYSKLYDKKIASETEKKSLEEQLHKLKQEALEKYGTDDINALKNKVQEMIAENERRKKEYQEHLDSIESNLKTIESEFRP